MLMFPALVNTESLWYGGIGNILFLSQILIDPSVVKSFPYYLFCAENICFFISFCSVFVLIMQQKGVLWS